MDVEVKPSSIANAGLGVFAGRDFSSQATVCEYKGRLLATEVAESSSYASDYCLRLSRAWSLDAQHVFSEGKYVNDGIFSQRQNVRFSVNHRTRRVVLKALRKISKGEELFVSYGLDYWTWPQRFLALEPRYQAQLERRARHAQHYPFLAFVDACRHSEKEAS